MVKSDPSGCGRGTRVVHSSSAQVLRDQIACLTPHEVTSMGSALQGTAGVVDLATTQLAFVRYGGDVMVEVPSTGGRVVATVPLGPMRVSSGPRDTGVTRESAFLLSESGRTLMKPDAWLGALVLAVDADRLSDHSSIVFGEEVPARVAGRTDGLLGAACRRAWAATAAMDEITSQAVLEDFVMAVEDHLMTAMVLAWQGGAGPSVRCAPSRMDELRQWLEHNHGLGVTTAQMARQLGLSVRQLQVATQDQLGLTPTQLLRDARLAGARRRLLSADPTRCTVASVAIEEGFSHVGRFSTAYRSRFGEYPAATLHRRLST